jgi:hypothetical protein
MSSKFQNDYSIGSFSLLLLGKLTIERTSFKIELIMAASIRTLIQSLKISIDIHNQKDGNGSKQIRTDQNHHQLTDHSPLEGICVLSLSSFTSDPSLFGLA